MLTNELGQPYHPDYLTKRFAKAQEGVDVPHKRLYDLRHTHATLLLEAGVPAKVISDRLGNASVSFTLDTHAESTPAMQREAANAVRKLLGMDSEAPVA